MANGFSMSRGGPGDYLTYSNPYSRMLQTRPVNTGTVTGGLAHVLQHGSGPRTRRSGVQAPVQGFEA